MMCMMYDVYDVYDVWCVSYVDLSFFFPFFFLGLV